MLASESDPSLAAAAVAHNHKLAQASLARDRHEIRYLEKVYGGTLPRKAEWRGSKTFVADAAWIALLPSWSLPRTLHVWDASVHIVADPAALQTKSLHCWAAVLRGCPLLTPGVLSGTHPQVSIKYHPALTTKRTLFISAGFRTTHRGVYDVVVHCVESLQSNAWTIVGSLAEFNRASAKKSVSALILATRAEKQVRTQPQYSAI